MGIYYFTGGRFIMATYYRKRGEGLPGEGVTARLALTLFLLILAFTTPLAASAGNSAKLFEAARTGDLSTVKKLVKSVDIESADIGGRTALMIASQEGHVPVVDFLTARGADVNARTMYGWSSLLAASQYGHTEVVRILLKKGADVETKNIYDETPLITASRKGNAEIVQALIDGGADVSARDQHGETALKNAKSAMHQDVVEILVEHGAVE